MEWLVKYGGEIYGAIGAVTRQLIFSSSNDLLPYKQEKVTKDSEGKDMRIVIRRFGFLGNAFLGALIGHFIPDSVPELLVFTATFSASYHLENIRELGEKGLSRAIQIISSPLAMVFGDKKEEK